jgi:hypothetical protein
MAIFVINKDWTHMNVPQDTGNTCDGQQYLATVAGGMQLNWAHL